MVNQSTLPHIPERQDQQKSPKQVVGLFDRSQSPSDIAVGRAHQAAELQKALGFVPVSCLDGSLSIPPQLGETET